VTSPKAPRVAVCIGAFEYGGQGTVLEQELLHLRDRFDLTLIAERIERSVPDQITTVQISSWRTFPAVNPKLVDLLKGFDLIHCIDSLGMMLAARATGRRFVVTSVGIAPARVRSTARSAIEGLITELAYPGLYRSATVVVAISAYVANWLRTFAGVEAQLIPLGVSDVPVLRPRKPPSRTLLYVGEVSRRKGIKDLVDGLQFAPKDVTLDIVGKGNAVPFQAEANRLGLGDRIRFHGILESTALSKAYASAFCTCSASLWEGFGLPVLEGFSFGRPSIVRAQGGMLELVQQSSAGCYFRKTADIAACIETITEDWEGFSERAITFASRHTWRRTFDSYGELFQSLV
jgi:glycosyltransferase involved in cell wall biosynthesis